MLAASEILRRARTGNLAARFRAALSVERGSLAARVDARVGKSRMQIPEFPVALETGHRRQGICKLARRMEPKPTILLVEDNDEDAFLLRRAFRQHNVDCALQVAEDGEAAIDYLAGNGKFADRAVFPVPALMLLDLKLPYVHGFEVLAWLAAQARSQQVRTIILTSSGEDCDRERAEQFGVQWYFVKPPTAELVATVLKELETIGSDAAAVPRTANAAHADR